MILSIIAIILVLCILVLGAPYIFKPKPLTGKTDTSFAQFQKGVYFINSFYYTIYLNLKLSHSLFNEPRISQNPEIGFDYPTLIANFDQLMLYFRILGAHVYDLMESIYAIQESELDRDHIINFNTISQAGALYFDTYQSVFNVFTSCIKSYSITTPAFSDSDRKCIDGYLQYTTSTNKILDNKDYAKLFEFFQKEYVEPLKHGVDTSTNGKIVAKILSLRNNFSLAFRRFAEMYGAVIRLDYTFIKRGSIPDIATINARKVIITTISNAHLLMQIISFIQVIGAINITQDATTNSQNLDTYQTTLANPIVVLIPLVKALSKLTDHVIAKHAFPELTDLKKILDDFTANILFDQANVISDFNQLGTLISQ